MDAYIEVICQAVVTFYQSLIEESVFWKTGEGVNGKIQLYHRPVQQQGSSKWKHSLYSVQIKMEMNIAVIKSTSVCLSKPFVHLIIYIDCCIRLAMDLWCAFPKSLFYRKSSHTIHSNSLLKNNN